MRSRDPHARFLASFPFAFCITIPNILRNTISPSVRQFITFYPQFQISYVTPFPWPSVREFIMFYPTPYFFIANPHRYRMLTKGKSHPDVKWPFRLWQNMFFIRSRLARLRSSNCCFLLIFHTLFNCMLACKSVKLHLLSNEWISIKEYSF